MKKILILFIFALTISLTSCNLGDLGNLGDLLPGGSDDIKDKYNEEMQLMEELNELLPGSVGFKDITDSITIPEDSGVTRVFQEEDGKGFVFTAKSIQSSMNDYVTVKVGVDIEGKISGIKVNFENPSDFKVNDYTLESFIGQDASLSDVAITSGATHSSEAVKRAVKSGFNVLGQNSLILITVSDYDLIYELIPTVFTGFVHGKQLAVSGNIEYICVSENEAGMIYILNAGDEYYLVVFNNMKRYKVFGLNDNKTELVEKIGYDSDVVTEAVSHALNNVIYEEVRNIAVAQFKKMMGTEDVVISPNSTEAFNTVCANVEINVDGQIYQGYYSRTSGFENMDIFVVIDSEGKICQVKAKTLIFNEEYFAIFDSVPSNYYQNMIGMSQFDDIDGLTMISGATLTSTAMATAIKDAFEAYNNVRVR